ncbi:hypothetical protein [Ruegeria sp. HKCCD7221]|uniref:hypothetical protein n=1 Tax=Ruegeria sp. HKCCD7221 TaxID=2683009 RepID=UPI00147AEE67|nr:hypothetical protein [Ruegeria sp. HKCCD7221]
MFEPSPNPDLLVAVDKTGGDLCAAVQHKVTRSVVATVTGDGDVTYHCAKTKVMQKAVEEALSGYRARLEYERTKT